MWHSGSNQPPGISILWLPLWLDTGRVSRIRFPRPWLSPYNENGLRLLRARHAQFKVVSSRVVANRVRRFDGELASIEILDYDPIQSIFALRGLHRRIHNRLV